MRIIIAPDSFKECLSSVDVATAVEEGIRKKLPDAETVCVPVADGGEGTVAALIAATGGRIVHVHSVDALLRPIRSFYGVMGDGKTAVIEMAAASGIELLKPEERNPMISSTFGTGVLLKLVLEAGFRDIVVGIGGSATNDGGVGMASALGFRFFDADHRLLEVGGGSLGNLASIDVSGVHPLLASARIVIGGDVQNLLVGMDGASRVYGPQKGATPEMVEKLEKNMHHFSKILSTTFGKNYAEIPGSGAAGGLGAGLMAFCDARMNSGFEIVKKYANLEEQISTADLVFTGEGKIDGQSAQGKTVGKIARLCEKYSVPVVALAGFVDESAEQISGLTAAFELGNGRLSVVESKMRAKELLASISGNIVELFEAGSDQRPLLAKNLFAPENSRNWLAANKLMRALLKPEN